MEVKPKKTRAPKTSSIQLEYLIGYMQSHNAFATGKLLGARGKAAHDTQWQQLTEELNRLEGPSKSVEAWKKLWCDQRNQARGRAAKAKADQKLTGNTGNAIQLKDLDLRILSIVDGESSVGLPIMEMGFGERPEDTTDPSLTLGLIPNTDSNEIIIIQEEQNATETTEESTSAVVQDEEETIIILKPQENLLHRNEKPSKPHTIVSIPTDEPLNQHDKPNNTTVPVLSNHEPRNQHDIPNDTTVLHNKTRQSLITCNIRNSTSHNRKRLRSSSVEETMNSFKDQQERHTESLQVMVENVSRIASATEEQTELLRKYLTLHKQTLDILSKTIESLKEKK